jgi:hypothetical protein
MKFKKGDSIEDRLFCEANQKKKDRLVKQGMA